MSRAGAKQTILTLQRATDVKSASGAISRTWATMGSVFAEIYAAGGSQTYAANEVQSGDDVDVKIRWMPGLNSADYRLIYTSLFDSPPVAVVYDIQSIGDKDGRRRELVVRCKVRHSGGMRGEST